MNSSQANFKIIQDRQSPWLRELDKGTRDGVKYPRQPCVVLRLPRCLLGDANGLKG